jgi:hypothetical protein
MQPFIDTVRIPIQRMQRPPSTKIRLRCATRHSSAIRHGDEIHQRGSNIALELGTSLRLQHTLPSLKAIATIVQRSAHEKTNIPINQRRILQTVEKTAATRAPARDMMSGRTQPRRRAHARWQSAAAAMSQPQCPTHPTAADCEDWQTRARPAPGGSTTPRPERVRSAETRADSQNASRRPRQRVDQQDQYSETKKERLHNLTRRKGITPGDTRI